MKGSRKLCLVLLLSISGNSFAQGEEPVILGLKTFDEASLTPEEVRERRNKYLVDFSLYLINNDDALVSQAQKGLSPILRRFNGNLERLKALRKASQFEFEQEVLDSAISRGEYTRDNVLPSAESLKVAIGILGCDLFGAYYLMGLRHVTGRKPFEDPDADGFVGFAEVFIPEFVSDKRNNEEKIHDFYNKHLDKVTRFFAKGCSPEKISRAWFNKEMLQFPHDLPPMNPSGLSDLLDWSRPEMYSAAVDVKELEQSDGSHQSVGYFGNYFYYLVYSHHAWQFFVPDQTSNFYVLNTGKPGEKKTKPLFSLGRSCARTTISRESVSHKINQIVWQSIKESMIVRGKFPTNLDRDRSPMREDRALHYYLRAFEMADEFEHNLPLQFFLKQNEAVTVECPQILSSRTESKVSYSAEKNVLTVPFMVVDPGLFSSGSEKMAPGLEEVFAGIK